MVSPQEVIDADLKKAQQQSENNTEKKDEPKKLVGDKKTQIANYVKIGALLAMAYGIYWIYTKYVKSGGFASSNMGAEANPSV